MSREKMSTTGRWIFGVPILAPILALTASPTQDYRSSVTGTEFDYILDTDPSTFLCLEFKGRGLREMPDKTGPSVLIQQAFIFMAYFDDGTSVDLGLDVDFETEEAAHSEAMRYAQRLGKLPSMLRMGVNRLVIHKGEVDATAFSDQGLIVVYSDNATKRLSTHDLEETLFHESVHAAWDKAHADSSEWRAAQETDGAFVTEYAEENPRGEDLAESALFAYTLLHHPERIPAADAARIRDAIPARIAFVESLLPPDEPIFFEVGPRYTCDESGETFVVEAERLDRALEVYSRQYGGTDECDVDLTKVGQLSDIVSNALMRGLDKESALVRSFLDGAEVRYSTSEALLAAASAEFGVDEESLRAEVEEFRHCNCSHGGEALLATDSDSAPATPVSAETSTLRPILVLNAWLLALLLVVNATTLAVLIKRFKT